MDALRPALDRKKNGTHYSDRMQRILGVCQDCNMLWHEERVTYRNGSTELKRVEDIEPAGTVLVTAQYEKYGLRVNPRLLNRLRTMGGQFAYALNVPVTTVEVDGNIVYVRVPRPSGESDDTLTFQQAWALAPSIPVGSVLLGVDDDHSQLVLELDSPTSAHVAVIGMTGSGKSTLMRTMILSAEMVGGARLALFDPSNGFWPLSGHPSVWRGGLFRDAEACELGLEALASSLGRTQYGLLYVFIDEVPDLVMQRPRVRDHLARLAQSGRHAGIHLILGAQHPLASEFGSLTMRNVPVRLVGKVADRTAAYHATGRSDTDASSLRGRGDFAAVNGGNIRHFQAAYLSPEALEAWAQRYPPRPPRLPVRMCALVGPGGDDDELMREGGNGGRPRDDIPPQIVDQIRAYIAENGRPPSSNWVYRLSRSVLPSGGFNREKARRALEAASAHLAQAQAPTS